MTTTMTQSPGATESEVRAGILERPAIAIISNSQTPYRLHLHRRISAELKQVRLWSVYTHETSNSSWEFVGPEEIGPVLFGKGESCERQDKPANALREWRRGGRIIRWMKENQIRFVVMMGYNDPGRIRIIRWCGKAGIPCFLFGDSNIYGDTATGAKASLKKAVVGWVVRSCAGVLPCGSLGRLYFIKYGAKPDRIFYFPYEPDYDLVRNLSADAVAGVAKRFGLVQGRRRLVYSGRLVDVKRVDLALKAFAAIAPRRPEWDMVIVGDGLLRESLRTMIPVELASRVIWTGFVDDQAVVSAVYRLSDVLVLPSDFEPWALVINEAVAAGLAVVASSVVGAAAELLQDGVNGRFFPPGDAQMLEEALLGVTEASKIDGMKAASPEVLEQWRQRGDPVQGLRRALESVGVIRPG